jgi:chitinase
MYLVRKTRRARRTLGDNSASSIPTSSSSYWVAASNTPLLDWLNPSYTDIPGSSLWDRIVNIFSGQQSSGQIARGNMDMAQSINTAANGDTQLANEQIAAGLATSADLVKMGGGTGEQIIANNITNAVSSVGGAISNGLANTFTVTGSNPGTVAIVAIAMLAGVGYLLVKR